jgi:hypothetical protein
MLPSHERVFKKPSEGRLRSLMMVTDEKEATEEKDTFDATMEGFDSLGSSMV